MNHTNVQIIYAEPYPRIYALMLVVQTTVQTTGNTIVATVMMEFVIIQEHYVQQDAKMEIAKLVAQVVAQITAMEADYITMDIALTHNAITLQNYALTGVVMEHANHKLAQQDGNALMMKPKDTEKVTALGMMKSTVDMVVKTENVTKNQ